MPNITIEQLRANIQNDYFHLSYFLYGEEPFLRDKAVKVIADRLLKDCLIREFNEDFISLKKYSLEDVITSAKQMLLMSEERVIVVTDLDNVMSTELKNNSLVDYLNSDNKVATVIFVGDKLDRRKKFTKLLLKYCTCIDFVKLSSIELKNWAIKRCKQIKLNLHSSLIEYVVNKIGSDVRKLSLELDKLKAFSLKGESIDRYIIDRLISDSKIISNFDLTTEFLNQNKERIALTLNKLLNDRVEPVMLLGMLAQFFKRLFIAKTLRTQGQSEHQISQQLNVSYSTQTEFFKLCQFVDLKVYNKILILLSVADRRIKRSVTTPRLQTEGLVYGILEVL